MGHGPWTNRTRADAHPAIERSESIKINRGTSPKSLLPGIDYSTFLKIGSFLQIYPDIFYRTNRDCNFYHALVIK